MRKLYDSRKAYHDGPHHKFQKQRWHAQQRGVEWLLTFEQWWAFWKEFWHLRGRRRDCLCMCRYGDTGPYSVDNVFLWSHGGNVIQALRRSKV